MIALPRFSYNLQRDFSAQASFFGYFGVFTTLAAAVAATLLTKGQVWSGDLHYRSNFNEAGFKCNSTAIYPGQQLGGIAYNSTFTYVSQSNFVYSGQKLSPCSVKPGYAVQIIGPPMSWPAITLNYTVTCETSTDSNATFAATTLNHGTSGSGVPNAVKAWKAIVGAMNTGARISCNEDGIVEAFLVDTAASKILLFTQDSIDFCTEGISNQTFTVLANLATLFEDLMEADFTSSMARLNPLPDLLFPCTKTEKVWAPISMILVECYTAVAATLGPSLLIVTWMLRNVASVDQVGEGKMRRGRAHNDISSSDVYLPTTSLIKHDSDGSDFL